MEALEQMFDRCGRSTKPLANQFVPIGEMRINRAASQQCIAFFYCILLIILRRMQCIVGSVYMPGRAAIHVIIKITVWRCPRKITEKTSTLSSRYIGSLRLPIKGKFEQFGRQGWVRSAFPIIVTLMNILH